MNDKKTANDFGVGERIKIQDRLYIVRTIDDAEQILGLEIPPLRGINFYSVEDVIRELDDTIGA